MTTHEFARQLLELPDENMRGRGVDQLWIDVVVKTRDLALRERNILRREVSDLKKEQA